MTPYEQLISNSFSCDWAESPLLLFSENVFSPLIYYSHLVPLVAVLLLAFIVWRQKSSGLINRLFITLSLLFATWATLDLLLWADVNPDHIMFAWTALVYIDPLIYFTSFYLVYVFVKKKDMPFILKVLGGIVLLPVIFLGPTSYTLTAFDYTNCDREALEGALWQYVYAIEVLILLAIVGFSVYSSWRAKQKDERTQYVLLAVGVFLFLAAFSFGNIIGSFSEDWTIAQYGLFGMPVFLGVILYLMTRFNTFNIRTLSTTVLVSSLWFLLFSILFLQTMEAARPVIIATLVIFSLIGTLLIRSVRKEVDQREKIEILAKELEEANEQQVNLIHFITHQIKGFVTKSRNIFSMSLEGDYGPVSDQLKPILQEGFNSDTKGAEMIQQILNASNIRLGKIEYRMAPFDVKALIDEAVTMLRPTAEAKGLVFNSTLGSEPVTINGDKEQLKNVFRNLIDNSIKYTPKGEVNVALEKKGGKILFSVKDTGVGITQEDMKVLFTEGGHGKESVKVNVESTGYGLYIVKQIVEGHKGKVWVESQGAGKGSQFYVEFSSL